MLVKHSILILRHVRRLIMLTKRNGIFSRINIGVATDTIFNFTQNTRMITVEGEIRGPVGGHWLNFFLLPSLWAISVVRGYSRPEEHFSICRRSRVSVHLVQRRELLRPFGVSLNLSRALDCWNSTQTSSSHLTDDSSYLSLMPNIYCRRLANQCQVNDCQSLLLRAEGLYDCLRFPVKPNTMLSFAFSLKLIRGMETNEYIIRFFTEMLLRKQDLLTFGNVREILTALEFDAMQATAVWISFSIGFSF